MAVSETACHVYFGFLNVSADGAFSQLRHLHLKLLNERLRSFVGSSALHGGGISLINRLLQLLLPRLGVPVERVVVKQVIALTVTASWHVAKVAVRPRTMASK